MKQLLFLVLLLPAVPTFNASLGDITRALSAGDASQLGQYFDQSVELAILDDEDIYSRAQATEMVRKFFATYSPKGFSQVHQGTSKGSEAQYCIGNLTAANGAVFRVYIYMKVENGNFLIQELRFDRE